MTETSDGSLWVRIYRSLWQASGDFVVVTVYVLFASAAILTGTANTIVRASLALPLAFFLPGYGVVAALVPSGVPRGEWATTAGVARQGRSYTGFDSVERIALSFGLSVAVLPILGVGLSLSGIGIGLPAILTALSAVAVVGTAVGRVRRLRLPQSERYSLPVQALSAAAYGGLIDTDSRFRQAANLFVVGSILLASAALGAGILSAGTAQSYTELQVLSENETGDLVAGDYPDEFAAGDSVPFAFSVANREGHTETYTVVVTVQRMERRGGDLEAVEQREIDRFQRSIGPARTWRLRHRVQTQMTGSDLRIGYLLYRGDAPDRPRTETAYRDAFVWVTVTDPERQSTPPNATGE